MTNVIKNNQYSPHLRVTALMLRKQKQTLRNSAENLRNFYNQEVSTLRSKLKTIAEEPCFTAIYGKGDNGECDPDDCLLIYKEPFEFKGTKKECEAYLYDNFATRICSDYDCTGQWFTMWFKVGYMGNDLWKVAEQMGRDV